jgi:hypothetical protein
MLSSAVVAFNAMLKAAPDNIDYNWSFYCGVDIQYKKETYLGFKVLKFKWIPKDFITLMPDSEFVFGSYKK